MLRLKKQLDNLSNAFNWLAAGAILIMMALTCADVVLRLFRHPIPGTYEIVGLMGTVGVSFALAYTTAKKDISWWSFDQHDAEEDSMYCCRSQRIFQCFTVRHNSVAKHLICPGPDTYQ